ncbi:hypothetical protein [Mesorhizobium sp. M7A.F.Ca.CA.002.12.1.1]|uniref:hypothetical protein n=1 Tax=Mesorhizobium sp. M7A.F.Ca.CA.002.12.1.1 TaxID=2496735 RepID=UPI000FC9EB5F|nr:hypothetical protein [Mesorhizobium sp. M7A.F.Ca.CA.002.12.1.1]RUX60174.1 hypothetical protein EN989_11195 [Mesorhizobium sp. M7A.F.Ca.CA.002.12.1.1]
MNLYHWAVASCLKEYSCGDIIVMAETVDEAREKAKTKTDSYLKSHRSWWWSYTAEREIHEDYVDDYNQFKRLLEEDMAHEPDVIESAVIFIRGSE